jgi:hypothetical protein
MAPQPIEIAENGLGNVLARGCGVGESIKRIRQQPDHDRQQLVELSHRRLSDQLYTANNLNQYTAIGSAHPTYDGNGNLTSDGHFTYCYDSESRLISVLSPGTCATPTTTVASYAHDAQGRRKSKTVGATTTFYVTDADNREVLEI